MANIIIKSEERRAHERYVAKSFGIDEHSDSNRREAAEAVAARSREAYDILKRTEGKK